MNTRRALGAAAVQAEGVTRACTERGEFGGGLKTSPRRRCSVVAGVVQVSAAAGRGRGPLRGRQWRLPAGSAGLGRACREPPAGLRRAGHSGARPHALLQGPRSHENPWRF